MWKYILIVCGVVSALLALMTILYIALIGRVRNVNTKIYKYKEEKDLKEENVLIIYQPSKHNTIQNIVVYIREEIAKTKYGYVIHTLDDKIENYDKYKRVIFVVPVYFGNIHNEFLKKVYQCRITNLIMVYNGLNKESIRQLKKYATTGQCDGGCNLIEVMCCEGGCIGGNANLNNQKTAKKLIDGLANQSKDIEKIK